MFSFPERLRQESTITVWQILKILSWLSIILSVSATLILLADQISYGAGYHGLSPLWGLAISLLFIFIYYLGKRRPALGSSLFIAVYFIFNTYFAYRWGVELPAVIIFYILLVVMTMILRGPKGGWIMAGAASLFLLGGAILEDRHLLNPNLYWRANHANAADKVPEIIAIIIVAVICALYTRQIKLSLKRVWTSEDLLRQERDNLETTVAQRTRELKQAQLEKMTQLYRFAEFGRLSAGIFHDLVNPLTAVNLNLHQIEKTKNPDFKSSQDNLHRALKATEKMNDFVITLKRQLKKESQSILFSVNEEIRQTILLLNYPLTKAGLNCDFRSNGEFHLQGDPIKFNQIILNLVANAIDASNRKETKNSEIKIRLKKHNAKILITIIDYGTGISPENQTKIFEPFFSTKPGKGLGIGLSATKNIIEKDYRGTISCQSQIGTGTKFTISLPLKNELSKNSADTI
ncbi:MAG TPA: ATP-binding protein [bacterium]|nr:ATP-binding protein [bacterium]HPT29864.1 ATP-binding protein [bacterium]